ncbi:MAG: histidine phosphatase family protein [Hylemonella sp.]|nr:histidine phosphatase family protein [Hylemonella sp.]
MKLWLVRHAQPLVEAGVCYGASDVAADAELTRSAAQGLVDALPHQARLISSPLQRCAQLAQALHSLRPDLQLQFDARLREFDFGCWEGQRWDTIAQQHFDAWTADFGDHRFGGRDSVNAMLQRVAQAHADTRNGAAAAVWVTHAGVMRAMSLLAQGVTRIESARQWPREVASWGEWREF